MQKTKKQLLGLAGLAAVGIMTAVAYAMPAAAAEDVPPEDDGNIHLVVQIRNGANTARIISPEDSSFTTQEIVPVTYRYEEAEKIEVLVEYKDASGSTVSKLVDSYVPTTNAGERTFNLDLTRFDSLDNNYKLIIRAIDGRGSINEDTVTFGYRAVTSQPEKPAENGDPQVEIEVTEKVDKVVVQVYDEDGNPIFVDKDGKEEPIILDRSDIGEDGKILVPLPFEKYGVEPGNYTVVSVAYDKDGQVISMSTSDVKYTPNTPDTPNSGFTIGDLNISRVDYLVTGLIVFGTVAGFAIYLVCRKSRR